LTKAGSVEAQIDNENEGGRNGKKGVKEMVHKHSRCMQRTLPACKAVLHRD